MKQHNATTIKWLAISIIILIGLLLSWHSVSAQVDYGVEEILSVKWSPDGSKLL